MVYLLPIDIYVSVCMASVKLLSVQAWPCEPAAQTVSLQLIVAHQLLQSWKRNFACEEKVPRVRFADEVVLHSLTVEN